MNKICFSFAALILTGHVALAAVTCRLVKDGADASEQTLVATVAVPVSPGAYPHDARRFADIVVSADGNTGRAVSRDELAAKSADQLLAAYQGGTLASFQETTLPGSYAIFVRRIAGNDFTQFKTLGLAVGGVTTANLLALLVDGTNAQAICEDQ